MIIVCFIDFVQSIRPRDVGHGLDDRLISVAFREVSFSQNERLVRLVLSDPFANSKSLQMLYGFYPIEDWGGCWSANNQSAFLINCKRKGGFTINIDHELAPTLGHVDATISIGGLRRKVLFSGGRLSVVLSDQEWATVTSNSHRSAGPKKVVHSLVKSLTNRLDLLEGLLIDSHRPPNQKSELALNCCVSIILPTYNRADCICDAIDSVIGQTYKSWRLIIVDDGSTDETRCKVAPYLQDKRIIYNLTSHQGAARARNHGLRIAAADGLISYLDSDNYFYANFLQKAIEYLSLNPHISLVYGALLDMTRGDATLVWQKFDRQQLEKNNYIDINCVVHRHALYVEKGGWDEELERLMDWDLLLRYTKQEAPARIAVMAACYRRRDESRITDTVPFENAYNKVKRKLA